MLIYYSNRWNAAYDEILKIEMLEDTFVVGYADDIAAVFSARNTNVVQRRLRQARCESKGGWNLTVCS